MRHPADRLAGFFVLSTVTSTRRAGAPQDLEQAGPRGVEAHALDVDDAARQCRPRGPPRTPRRDVARDLDAAAPQPLAAVEPDREAVTVERYAERRQGPLRMIPCRGGLDDDGLARGWRPASRTPLLTWALGTSGR